MTPERLAPILADALRSATHDGVNLETAARVAAERVAPMIGPRYPQVQGRCPTCGAASLFLGEGGFVTCSWLTCSRPDHATDVLDGGTPFHDINGCGRTQRHELGECAASDGGVR